MEVHSHLGRALIAIYSALVVALSITAIDPAYWEGFVVSGLLASALLLVIWKRVSLSAGQVLLLAVVFRLIFFPHLPSLSDDAFRYVWDGWLQIRGLNPYLYAPSDPELASFHTSSLYSKLNSAEYYSVYPPLSQLLFALGGGVYSAGWEASYYLIKGLLVAAELGGVYLMTRIVEPETIALYAWNPLVLVETAGQAHTEAAMIGLLLAAVWCVRQGYGGWASVALAGAGLVKLYPFVLFPLLWRRFGWRSVWPGVIVTLGLSLPYVASGVVGNVMESLRLYVRLFEFNAGPYYGVKYLFTQITGEDWSKVLGPAFGIAFGGMLLVFYGLDWRKEWSFAKSSFWILVAYLACSTTVHPWYLLGPLAMGVFVGPPLWAVYWLGAISLGTYLFYVGGPYWIFVITGWGGAALLVLACWRRPILQWIQRRRARSKWARIAPYLACDGEEEDRSLKVLDLGAGEGYVGREVERHLSAEVVLADVVDFNQTDLPLVEYDGHTLPFSDDQFDSTLLYFVLHHSEDPDRVLSEAFRVTQGRVIMVESLSHGTLQLRLLRWADRLANRLRSGGAMRAQESQVSFRSAEAWRRAVRRQGGFIFREEQFGVWPHPQLLLVVES